MLHFIYCYMDCLGMTSEEALRTLYVAKKYLLPALEEACFKVLKTSLCADNIWEIYASCLRHPDDRLLNECHRFFGENGKNAKLP